MHAAAGAWPRRRLLLQAAGACLWVPGAADAAGADEDTRLDPWPWRPPGQPVLHARTLEGQPRTLADFAGRPLIVNLWASWCAPCLDEMPALDALARELAPQGWAFIALNHGEMPERVRRFAQELGLAGPVLLDREQATLPAWGGRSLPATFIFDAQGRPRRRAQGARDWRSPALRSALLALG